MSFSFLHSISPIDGRYSDRLKELRDIFSEFSLLKYRLKIEILWISKLSQCPFIKELQEFDKNTQRFLKNIIDNFNDTDAIKIKQIEYKINHDVKAIEYFLKEKFKKIVSLRKASEFIHFACTSDDINNLAYALMLKNVRNYVILPEWKQLILFIKKLAFSYKSVPLLSRTHGQPASPTTFGKEFANVAYRMNRQYKKLRQIEILGKINGAVGNYNAHLSAYPNVDWISLSKDFVNSLEIKWNPFTTQIEPHDYISELFSCIIRFNNVLIDFNQDMWGYMSLNYFRQRSFSKEIGSSTMPHKINPIGFENSEGNLGISNSLLNHMSNKLQISRWQRDLSDSTVLRNLGVGIAYSIIAYKSTLNNLCKIEVNKKNLFSDLDQNWNVIGEAVQTVMRKYGIKQSYEKVKKIINKKNINKKDFNKFIDNLDLPKSEKSRLKKITPRTYIGCADEIINYLK